MNPIKLTITQKIQIIEDQLAQVKEFSKDPRVTSLLRQIYSEREDKITELQARLMELDAERAAERRKKFKPRWPEHCPQHVVNFCKAYWSGTTEASTFRIHEWNDKGVVTSYPGKMYQSGMSRNYGQACFELLRLDSKATAHRPDSAQSWFGRTPITQFRKALGELK